MKDLLNYINESFEQDGKLLFESNESFDSLEDVYEAIGDKLLADMQVNEGKLGNFFRKLAGMGDKIDKKAEDIKKAASDKIDNMSTTAKSAVEKIKKKAGDSWDDIKDVYTSTIALVDDAITNSKTSIEALAKAAGRKIEDVEASIATLYTNALTTGGELGRKLNEWAADSTKGTAKYAAINTFYLGSILASKAGIDSSTLMDLMSVAGIK